MHTIESLQQLVDDYKSQTQVILEAHPAIREIQWEVHDIPYAAFEGYRTLRNKDANDNNFISISSSGNKLFYFAVNCFGRGCQISFWSTAVKFKHSYEVLEAEETN